jgi:hypothetical protein
MKTPKHLAILEAMTTLLLANKKNILLPALLVLWVLKCNYEWRITNYEAGCYGNMALIKTMQTLPMTTQR